MTDLDEKLKVGLRDLGEDPNAHPCAVYLAYLELLRKWGRAYNLTGVREPGRMLAYHVLDSLSLLPFLRGKRCLDLGTGAGLPGLILALARPDLHWVLLDSNRKKIRFLNRALGSFAVKNAEVVQDRVE
ncbi:MAG: 16S rRNA (guanine(527)-N(7))-methyltransferase RsmG, partial [Longimicrobiales bacterium]